MRMVWPTSLRVRRLNKNSIVMQLVDASGVLEVKFWDEDGLSEMMGMVCQVGLLGLGEVRFDVCW